MVNAIIRDAPFGQLVRILTGNRIFKYAEEDPNFRFPISYAFTGPTDAENTEKQELRDDSTFQTQKASIEETVEDSVRDMEKVASASTSVTDSSARLRPVSSNITRIKSLPYTPERLHQDEQAAIERTESRPIAPTKTADGLILVDWYSTDDPENPQNWSFKKKIWTALLIDIYTFVVYCSSSIYVSSEELVRIRFGVAPFKASLGLALYVLGYGIGPLIFAPLSEVPTFGRNIPYITTFALFTTLALPAALVDNLGGLLVLRFFLGFFGSPCLANGGASMGDMFSLLYLPYAMAFWVSAAFAAPALGPLLSGFAVYAENWRWSQWEVLWMAGPVFLLFFFFLPETSPSNILLHRAARLRKASGNENIRSQTEIERKDTPLSTIILEAIWKPMEITFKDPAILFVNIYTALIYGIYYSFFEVFALVYPVMYGFNVGRTGLVFLCIIVGCIISMAIYFSYLHFYLIPDVLKNGLRAQEFRLRPALIACFGPTIGLFMFAWLANPSIHWVGTVVGCTIYAVTVYVIMQCIFTYVPMSYPQYAASLFAGNDFFRSLFAFGSVLFSRSMYVNLGVDKGLSLLAGLSVMGIIGMWVLYIYGARLRARSKFAVS
ncbi:multidrug transporter [Paraphaeosphaeria sporulosa]|uniref:Multidrug transporter n=1 Tax=Paraphaeosphaeria sporulosa TaxID=1460663 RepID=A0A177CHF1_9PLEO|nr:multidrug transporter [Paraphaeosphaeria sporulosa]OAG06220.1 multidrug transporter [Paraphaeosphaeria sporulosa]